MKVLKRKNKLYDTKRFRHPQIRVWHRKEKPLKGGGVKSACYHLKCGCCDQTIDIYYGGGGLEINGVNGALDDWREILLPLLDPKNNKDETLMPVPNQKTISARTLKMLDKSAENLKKGKAGEPIDLSSSDYQEVDCNDGGGWK